MYNEELCHHGIKGQKWGVRRFQNKDGSLTSTSKKRRDNEDEKQKRRKVLIRSGQIAAGIAISIIGAKIATDPHIRDLAYKAISVKKSVPVSIDDLGPVIVDKFGNVIDIDI